MGSFYPIPVLNGFVLPTPHIPHTEILKNRRICHLAASRQWVRFANPPHPPHGNPQKSPDLSPRCQSSMGSFCQLPTPLERKSSKIPRSVTTPDPFPPSFAFISVHLRPSSPRSGAIRFPLLA